MRKSEKVGILSKHSAMEMDGDGRERGDDRHGTLQSQTSNTKQTYGWKRHNIQQQTYD